MRFINSLLVVLLATFLGLSSAEAQTEIPPEIPVVLVCSANTKAFCESSRKELRLWWEQNHAKRKIRVLVLKPKSKIEVTVKIVRDVFTYDTTKNIMTWYEETVYQNSLENPSMSESLVRQIAKQLIEHNLPGIKMPMRGLLPTSASAKRP